MDTCGEDMLEPFRVSRCHEDQQQADQQRQPVGFQEADRVVRAGEDASPRPDAEKVAQQLKDHLRASHERQKGAVGAHERVARFAHGQLSGVRLRMCSYHSRCSLLR